MQRTLSVAHGGLQTEIAAIQQQVAGSAGGHGVGEAAQRFAISLSECSSGPGHDGGLWLRVGLAMAGGVLAFVVAKRLGAKEVRDRSKRWRESENQALSELRQASQADAIPSSPTLVSDSQVAVHRGYR